MGDHDVSVEVDAEALRAFTAAVLDDLTALERMLAGELFETGTRRIGAEQEMFLVDAAMRPVPAALDVIRLARDPRLTTEMALFNLEANLSPRIYTGGCLGELERELIEVVSVARQAAARAGAQVLMAGILPTLRQSDLGLSAMTPSPRYRALSDAMTRLRGDDFYVHIRGLDDLETTHDNVMMEACNTSFQIHFQVAPDEFAKLYNLAQVVTAPVLACAVNAPVLFGRRLWQETRIALYERSCDERSPARQARGHIPRVQFGSGWIRESVLEIYREDVSRFRILLARELDEPATRQLDRGLVPKLKALCLHNGTIYRWNRACYGVTGGRPHLRIEERALPAGPSLRDEVANAAFFYGLMTALGEEHAAIDEVMSWDDASANFYAAARDGLKAQLAWIGGRPRPANDLILEELLPAARAGLRQAGIDADDAARYLDVIEERVRSGRTGAEWAYASLSAMGEGVSPELRDQTLARATVQAQLGDAPVHTWPLASADETLSSELSYRTVGQIMVTDLFTVRPDDLVDLAANVMAWQHVRHVPVEDDAGRLMGLVSHRALLALVTRGGATGSAAVRELMDPAPETVSPETPTVEAIDRLLAGKAGCLLVVKEGRLVGIVTAHDVMKGAAKVLKDRLAGGG